MNTNNPGIDKLNHKIYLLILVFVALISALLNHIGAESLVAITASVCAGCVLFIIITKFISRYI